MSAENRLRILRLIENMTLGRNAVGYLTESMHGAGSPQVQRVQIARQSDLEYKKKLAKNLAGVTEDGDAAGDIPLSPHQGRMFPDGEND